MANPRLATHPLSGKTADDTLHAEDEDIARQAIRGSIGVKEKLSIEGLSGIVKMAKMIALALSEGRKLMLFGNGGSAADAQHFAAELVGKFRRVRRPLRAMALTTNSSIITALGNDFGFEEIYSRQIKALGDEGDVVVAISTSGKSKDVLKGVEEARRCGAKTIGLTGSSGGELAKICDHAVIIPSDDVQRIQECHTLVSHIVCELIERMTLERE